MRHVVNTWKTPASLAVALTAVACALIGLAISSTSEAGGRATSKAPIVIADTCDCTGPAVSSTGGWARSLAVWGKWVNAHGGILGHPVQIIQKDTQANPVVGLAAAKALLGNSKVVAMIPGAVAGAVIAPVIDKSGVPVVGGYGDDALWFTDSHVYPVSTTPNNVAALLAAIGAQGKSNKNGAAFYCVEVASCKQSVPLFEAGIKKVGGKLVFQAPLSGSAPDYTAQCLAAKSAGASYLYLAEPTTVVIRVMQACAKNNYKPTYVEPNFDSTLLKVPEANGTKVAFGDQIFSSKAAATFLAAVNKYDPSLKKLPSWGQFDFQAWLSGQEVARAIVLGKPTGAITRATVFNGLYRFHNDTLGGTTPPLTFHKGKAPSIPCGFVGEISNGRLKGSPTAVC